MVTKRRSGFGWLNAFSKVTILGLLINLGGTPAIAKSVLLSNEKDGPVIGKWMAVGSGCRSNSDELGDVTLRTVESEGQAGSKAYRLRFELSQYALRPLSPTEDRPEPSKTHFARECALRVSVQPPAGMRFATASARTVAQVSKDAGSALLVASSLKVGASTVASHQRQFEKESSFRSREEIIELLPGRIPGAETPVSECGQGRVVGVDLTFLANKNNPDDTVEGVIGRDRSLEMVIGLESCE